MGFEPTPLRNGALSHRLRPLGQTVLTALARVILLRTIIRSQPRAIQRPFLSERFCGSSAIFLVVDKCNQIVLHVLFPAVNNEQFNTRCRIRIMFKSYCAFATTSASTARAQLTQQFRSSASAVGAHSTRSFFRKCRSSFVESAHSTRSFFRKCRSSFVESQRKNCLHFSICACHPCAGAMLIFSVSFQF